MKKALLLCFMFVFSFNVYAHSCTALEEIGLKQYQIDTMYDSVQYGKERGWGYTLAVISFRESSAGNPKFMRNPNDPSAGYHGVLLTHVVKHFGMEDTPSNNKMAEDMLMNSHGASAWFAMSVLDFWSNYHKGNWEKTIRSYNGGFYWRGDRPEVIERTKGYYDDVSELMKHVKMCNWM